MTTWSPILKRGPKISIEDLAKGISSPDVKGTYDGLVIPRKLPGPNNTRGRRQARL